MTPADFPQRTKVLQPPAGSTPEECSPLAVHTDGQVCTSRWRPDAVERAAIAAGEDVYVQVHSGPTQPPILVRAGNPFGTEEVMAMLAIGTIEDLADALAREVGADHAPRDSFLRVLRAFLPLYQDALHIAELGVAVEEAHRRLEEFAGGRPVHTLQSERAAQLLEERARTGDDLRRAVLAFRRFRDQILGGGRAPA